MSYVKSLSAAGLLLGLAPVSLAFQGAAEQTVIFTEITTDPSSIVPGYPGTPIDQIDRAIASPDGSHWAVTLFINTGATTDDELLIVDGAVVIEEGQNYPYLPAGRNFGFLDSQIGLINSGAWAISADMDGDTLDDDINLYNDGLGNTVVTAQENFQINGAPAGWLEDSISNGVVTSSGSSYEADLIDGGPVSGMDNLIMHAGAILLQTQVDSPTGQFSGLTETYDVFDFQDFYMTPDGSNWLLQGDLTGDTAEDDFVAINGAVVLQENYPIPGGPVDVIDNSGIAGVYMAANGDWMARGDFDVTNDGWVVYNGAVVAQEGTAPVPGSTELYDSTFFLQTCNTVGDWVVGGSTDAATTNDAVIVLNGTTIVAREGDPVDLDNNGVFDDDVYFNFFGTDDASLTDDLKLHLTGSLQDGADVTIGDFYMIIDLTDNSTGVAFCDPADNNSTGFPTKLTGAFGSGVGSDLHLEAAQGPPTQFGYFLVGTAVMDPGTPISDGHLCLTGSFGRYNFGTDTNSVGQFDAAGILQNAVGSSTTGTGFDVPLSVPIAGNPMIMAGDTWHFQLWHREDGGASNFSNGLSVTF